MYTNNSKCGSNEIFVVLPLVRQASEYYENTMRILWEYYEKGALHRPPFLFCQAMQTLETNRHQQILPNINDCQQILQQSKHINNFGKYEQRSVDINEYQQISTQSIYIYICMYPFPILSLSCPYPLPIYIYIYIYIYISLHLCILSLSFPHPYHFPIRFLSFSQILDKSASNV